MSETLETPSPSQEIWEQQDERTQSLLAEVLEDKDTAFRVKVLNLVVKHGLSSNDPLFLVLVATGALQVMLEEAPSAIHLSLESVKQQQQQQVKAALNTVQAEIAQAVRQLIDKTEVLQLKRPSKVLIPGLSLFALVFSLGLLSGVATTVALRQLASSGRMMTLAETAILQWANSQEGKYAKNLWEWNESYLESGQCLKDMSRLKIKLTFGSSKAVSGFCALWVVPPNQRQYQ